MKRIHLAVLLVTIGLVLGACGSSDDGGAIDPGGQAATGADATTGDSIEGNDEDDDGETPNSPSPTAVPTGGAVLIKSFQFTPTPLNVPAGTTVEWTNEDGTDHTVTADDGTFDGELGGRDTFSHLFDEAGTFAYHCEIHPSMKGEVVVQ